MDVEHEVYGTRSMNLKNTVVKKKKNRFKRPYIGQFNFYEMSRKCKPIKTKGILVVAWAGSGNRETTNGQEISSGEDGNVLKLDYDESCTTL